MFVIKLDLIFLEESDSDFNGKTYHMITFLDANSLNIIRGVNVSTSIKFVKYKKYSCVIEFIKNKLRVVSVVE